MSQLTGEYVRKNFQLFLWHVLLVEIFSISLTEIKKFISVWCNLGGRGQGGGETNSKGDNTLFVIAISQAGSAATSTKNLNWLNCLHFSLKLSVE